MKASQLLCACATPLAVALVLALYSVRRRRLTRTTSVRTSTICAPLPAATLRAVAHPAEAAAAVREQGVCIMEAMLDAAAVVTLCDRIAALTPKKKQNRREGRWEHVHDPANEVFTELAVCCEGLDPLPFCHVLL